jgi:hypothetical protein
VAATFYRLFLEYFPFVWQLMYVDEQTSPIISVDLKLCWLFE